MSESLPATPPTSPSSSPAISTSAPVMPRSARKSAAKRAESDLSVRPISTCLTSLVMRGSERPAACAVLASETDHLAEIGDPRGGEPIRNGLGERSDVRLFRICPRRERDQVDLPAVEPGGDDLCLKAACSKLFDRSLGRFVEAGVLGGRSRCGATAGLARERRPRTPPSPGCSRETVGLGQLGVHGVGRRHFRRGCRSR